MAKILGIEKMDIYRVGIENDEGVRFAQPIFVSGQDVLQLKNDTELDMEDAPGEIADGVLALIPKKKRPAPKKK